MRFGTPAPLQYFDSFYNAELFLRAHGTYSIKITDPILFYANAIPKNRDQVEIDDINEQYLSEFLTAMSAAINQYSANGERVSFLPSKGMELSKYLADILDEDWKKNRGMEIASVAVASISYTDDSQKLINMRNQGAMLSDAGIREGYVQGAIAKGLQDAGSNPNGAANAFMGMNMGMNGAGGFMQAASATNQAQMQQQQAQQQAQAAQNANAWTCPKCGTENTGKFCSNCGTAKPEPQAAAPKIEMACSACGAVVDLSNGVPKFCPNCGQPFVAKPIE
jgi:membrane protease subunit (stomatin/prohibitin family)